MLTLQTPLVSRRRQSAASLSMRRTLLLLLAASVTRFAIAAPIDFTPASGTRKLEGIVFPQVNFHRDGRTITYEPPKDWAYTGDANHFIVTPPNSLQAQGKFEQTQLQAPQVFDAAALEELRRFVLSSIPADAQDAKIVSEEANPVRINGKDSYEIIATYTYFGQRQQVGVIFASYGDMQLRCRFVAHQADFVPLYRAFRASLFTLS